MTMHDLLTHTAGFEDRVTGMAVVNVSDTEPLAVSVRKYMPAQVFTPGETVSYSNHGIALAAYVIERHLSSGA
jgi:CubicO group peptidase (beta-lactamase class C family)